MVKRFVTGLIDNLNSAYLKARPLDPGIFNKPPHWTSLIGPRPQTRAGLENLSAHLAAAVRRCRRYLLSRQDARSGYWCAELRADTTLESDTIMLLNLIGRGASPKIPRLAAFILKNQNPDGGWPIYRNGPSDISATVKAYWALKFAGYGPDSPALAKARARIAQLGGIHRVNTYSKFYMAMFGLYDWRGVPSIPPEIALSPTWFYFNIYEMSSWSRTIAVPLAIVWAKKPRFPCPPQARLDELFPDARRGVPLSDLFDARKTVSWTNFFLSVDSLLKLADAVVPFSLRRMALESTYREVVTHLEGSDGLGAIFPAIVNSIIALHCLGHGPDDPLMVSQLAELERLELDRGEDGLEIQPCLSPVWDTALSIIALAESGLSRGHPALRSATSWLLDSEVRRPGDWKVKNPHGPVGGWPFEFRNDFYPDIDDTAMVLLALRQVFLEETDGLRREQAFLRGLNWLLSMQSKNGGWAAFDKDNTKSIFTKVPFADHNAMIDPPTADVTARVLEMLGSIGYDRSYPIVERAIAFVRREQEPDGSWFGRWGVNYIYGTWQALRGLKAIGEGMQSRCVQKAIHWLRSVQNADGGFGESCASYHNPNLKGRGPSTPSQTAWGLMGLLSALPADDPAVERAARWLLERQNEAGDWDETEFTGTGFPKVFYLQYTLYRVYFPLMALGQYHKALPSASLYAPLAAAEEV
ncbi:MAG: squalene--hopene cyclase [Elusimicrobia bacterium]|nr:squalene--hopene cyclase [Elusimicrobiota bacterium]